MDADLARLCQLAESGLTLAQIGRRVELSAATICRRLAGMDVARRRKPRVTTEERSRILQLSDDGEDSVRRIAAAVRRNWHTVREILDAGQRVHLATAHRCPTCGNRIVTQHCLICRSRDAHACQHVAPSTRCQAQRC